MSKINNDFIDIDYIKNELKEVYSINEVKTNKVWINGKPIYKKVIYISSLPNATATQYEHNIKNIDEIVYHYGIAIQTSGNTRNLVYINPGAGATISYGSIGYEVSKTHASILSQNLDRRNYSAYITIEYTKTTD